MVGDPIHRGWVRVAGEEVVEVNRGVPPSAAIDLGDVALLPGLVNAHTHLEFSDCRHPIGHVGIALSDWIAEVVSARGATTPEQKQKSIVAGLTQSRDAGVRLIGEITTPPCEYPDISAGPTLVTFAEVLGLSESRAQDRYQAAVDHNLAHRHGAWSPHSPYSTTADLVCRCVQQASSMGRPVAMHVAESADERELISEGTGRIADALKRMGVWRDDLFPWAGEGFGPLIDTLAQAPRALLVHGNDLQDSEIERVASHPNLSVVYCPRTHAFFDYPPHPVGQLIKRGIRVALGTDSRASNPDLCLWKEVQHLLNHRGDLPPDQVLAMATFNGAEALGLSQFGRIAAGCRPGLGTVATSATRVEQLWPSLATCEYVPLLHHEIT